MRKTGLRNLTSSTNLFLRLIALIKSVFMVEIPAALAALRNIQGLNLHTKQKLSLKMSVKQKLSLRQKLKNLVIQAIYSLLSKRKTAGKLTVIKDGVTGRKSG